MSAQRKLRRSIRRAMGDKPNARVDAMVCVHPQIDRLLLDSELQRARHRMPLDVARSKAKRDAWQERINRRLAVPEHVRLSFAGPVTP